jgi:hypothetical protein
VVVILEEIAVSEFSPLLSSDHSCRVGRHPEPSESQRKAIEKLAGKLYLRPPKNSKSDEEAEDIVDIDLLDAPRVILYDGKILKKSERSFLPLSPSVFSLSLSLSVCLLCLSLPLSPRHRFEFHCEPHELSAHVPVQ